MKRGAPDKNPPKYFSEGELDRVDMLVQAVTIALMPYRHPERYAEH